MSDLPRGMIKVGGRVIFKALDPRALVDDFSPVQKLVYLAGQADKAEGQEWADKVFDMRRQSYEGALEAEVARVGCGGPVRISAGPELKQMRKEADQVGAGIANTYNYSLAGEIKRIGEDTPTANRHVYASRLFYAEGNWAGRYWQDKTVQVGESETAQGANQAVEAFYRYNDVGVEGAEVWPSPTVCGVCANYVAGNPYKSMDDLYRKCSLPAHPRCLPPGQKVLTVDGWKAIETVTVGERMPTPLGVGQVQQAFARQYEGLLYRLTVGSHVVEVTGGHPVLVVGGWFPARGLHQGDRVVAMVNDRSHGICGHIPKNGACAYIPIDAIALKAYAGQVYNLQVDGPECFVAEGVVVHNCPHHGRPTGTAPKLTAQECKDLWRG